MNKQSGYQLDYWADMAHAILEGYDGDPESAHSEEDELLAEFVSGVADGYVSDPQAAAKVLREKLLSRERRRWYA